MFLADALMAFSVTIVVRYTFDRVQRDYILRVHFLIVLGANRFLLDTLLCVQRDSIVHEDCVSALCGDEMWSGEFCVTDCLFLI